MFSLKVFGAVVALALAAGAVAAIPGFTPKVEAGPTRIAIKGDRLDLRATNAACRQDTWPFGCDWQAPATARAEYIAPAERTRSKQPRPKVQLSTWKRYIENSAKPVN